MTIFYNICSVVLYISLYMIASVCLHFSAYAKDKKEKKLFYFLAAGLVIVFAALRNGVGTDYYNYSNEYKQVGKISVGTYFKTGQYKTTTPALFLIIKIAHVYRSERLFFLLSAAAVYVPASVVLLKNKNNVSVFLSSFAFLTTMYTMGFNIMKQAAAVSFAFLALQYMLEKKPIVFFVNAFIAVCFHQTAVIILPFYLLNLRFFRDKDGFWKSKAMCVVPICAVLLRICYPLVLKMLGERFSHYLSPVASDLGNNYSFYLSAVILLGILFFSEKLKIKNQNNVFYLMMMLVGVIFESLGFVSGAIKRIMYYFSVFGVLIIPQMTVICEPDKGGLLPDSTKKQITVQWYDLLEAGIVVYYVLLFFVEFYLFKHADIIPFKI